MLYDTSGRVIGGAGRRDDGTVDGFQLHDGAIVSLELSMDLHSKIKNNSALRERLEVAQRQSNDMMRAKGLLKNKKREILHLALLRSDEDAPGAKVIESISKNMEFGNKIQERRQKEAV
jgi:hypothetical protein